MSIRIFTKDQQASGQFDEGKLKEQKPIGFPGEGSAVDRVGTLFYWAWFQAEEDAHLPLHPHRGFEIISYLLKGTVHHQDTLGNERTIHTGGLQVMQTGSGVQHSERYEKGTSGFQIWFEPYMGEANYATPTYVDYENHELPTESEDGISIKTILGDHSPIHLVADTKMWDVQIPGGSTFDCVIPTGYSIAGLVVEGQSKWTFENETKLVDSEFFVVCDADELRTLKVESVSKEGTRAILIQVPSVLPYPSYKQVRIRAEVKKDQ
ncbi:pirin family protein [Ammoniphilus resinae]|uniref:Redox-sensitive bicupin YhaK (Pirin superfamily) n=1 Tax=Ammoniphilus resinae TaxID=861532 RepID=A0ABS4GS38_9BACL|nr:pirin family protein [Ammoniphilus resinae]MBP1933083.1 redox-sensitive bicupin YhaK (pirin superfamily) [Ammoniphilus resinae]